jgi:RNA recognition motif-containing protein
LKFNRFVFVIRKKPTETKVETGIGTENNSHDYDSQAMGAQSFTSNETLTESESDHVQDLRTPQLSNQSEQSESGETLTERESENEDAENPQTVESHSSKKNLKLYIPKVKIISKVYDRIDNT